MNTAKKENVLIAGSAAKSSAWEVS